MLIQDLTGQIEQDTAARDEKTETKAKKMELKAEAESTLADTIATRDDDMKYLEDLKATCAQKASDFESRQQLRAEEIEAIEKAIEIISSSAVQGNAEKHLPTLLQVKSSSFVQLRGESMNPNQVRVQAFLQAKAKQLNSRVLSALAARV